MVGRSDGWTVGRTDGRPVGQTGGRTDGWAIGPTVYINSASGQKVSITSFDPESLSLS
jgi:hypothetical protein